MRPPVRIRAPAAALLIAAGIAIWFAAGAAGERHQAGNLQVALRGHITPLELSRRLPSPVDLNLAAGLRTVDGSLLPRVKRVEVGLPTQGVVSTRGLPVCTVRRLRNATRGRALAVCRPALLGRGTVEAAVVIPGQGAFQIHAHLLAFNGPLEDGHRLLLLYAYARRPPTVVVLPFRFERHHGRLGLTIGADLPGSLGPWPHLARFKMRLGRSYRFHGRRQSFLSASCPIPPRFTAGFFSLAKVTYTLIDGRRISIAITRGCRGI
ncbi:MAG TPA: hypothetical protein VFN85_02405 [Solirubrobacterales bacterium]|nr:hypothetical protein [Solirubrobacterales bacterium]